MLRQQFAEELEQLRLQVELVAVRVDQNLELVRLEGPEAARIAMVASGIGRAIDRLGVRLRYLITGDPDHPAAEIR